MARGRMIDKRIGMSKKLGKVHDKARTLYFMIYPHLDREGRIKFEDIEDLKDEIIPKFKDWPLKKIAEALNELADIELIILYPNKKEIAMQFLRFEDFQYGLRKDREAESLVPPAPEDSGVYRINPLLSLSLSSRKLKEGSKEKEENILKEEFSQFWNIYNHKIAEKDAFKAFKALRRKGIELERILKCTNGYLGFLKSQKIHKNFKQKKKYPAGFLRNDYLFDYEDFKYEPPL